MSDTGDTKPPVPGLLGVHSRSHSKDSSVREQIHALPPFLQRHDSMADDMSSFGGSTHTSFNLKSLSEFRRRKNKCYSQGTTWINSLIFAFQILDGLNAGLKDQHVSFRVREVKMPMYRVVPVVPEASSFMVAIVTLLLSQSSWSSTFAIAGYIACSAFLTLLDATCVDTETGSHIIGVMLAVCVGCAASHGVFFVHSFANRKARIWAVGIIVLGWVAGLKARVIGVEVANSQTDIEGILTARLIVSGCIAFVAIALGYIVYVNKRCLKHLKAEAQTLQAKADSSSQRGSLQRCGSLCESIADSSMARAAAAVVAPPSSSSHAWLPKWAVCLLFAVATLVLFIAHGFIDEMEKIYVMSYSPVVRVVLDVTSCVSVLIPVIFLARRDSLDRPTFPALRSDWGAWAHCAPHSSPKTLSLMRYCAKIPCWTSIFLFVAFLVFALVSTFSISVSTMGAFFVVLQMIVLYTLVPLFILCIRLTIMVTENTKSRLIGPAIALTSALWVTGSVQVARRAFISWFPPEIGPSGQLLICAKSKLVTGGIVVLAIVLWLLLVVVLSPQRSMIILPESTGLPTPLPVHRSLRRVSTTTLSTNGNNVRQTTASPGRKSSRKCGFVVHTPPTAVVDLHRMKGISVNLPQYAADAGHIPRVMTANGAGIRKH